MSSDSTPVIVAAAISGLLCLLIGGAASYFLLAPAPTPSVPAQGRAPEPAGPQAGNSKTRDTQEEGKTPDVPAGPAAGEVEKLRNGNAQLVKERDQARQDNESLKEKLAQTENELKALRALEDSRRGKLAINFAQYADLKELQDANWQELGGALHALSPMMLDLAKSAREGKEPDNETIRKIGEHNIKLIKLAVALDGKLPTHAGNVNGEYTHPAAQVNLLASQLEALGDPLTGDQKLKLAEIGEEYEKRWQALQKGYNADTLDLQKVLDEADLKMWFTERMFSVTTQQQKLKVVDPSVEGIMMLDLYSPGLLLLPLMNPVHVPGTKEPKQQFKEWLAPKLGAQLEQLNGVEYAFDDWRSKLQLEPLTAAQARVTHVNQVLQAGRAQLALMQTLAATALSSAEQRKKVLECKAIGVPYVIRQD